MSSELLIGVGARIRALEEERGLSQKALAKILGMDRAYLGRIERGGQNISILTAARIAAPLGEDLATLFQGATTSPANSWRGVRPYGSAFEATPDGPL